ncbi:MAG: hypothetical protein NTV79_02435, partial [Candidatus Aureabacteria bacterium]|nr:hypothetical protein [Candidatus Auribacterota bacterium]
MAREIKNPPSRRAFPAPPPGVHGRRLPPGPIAHWLNRRLEASPVSVQLQPRGQIMIQCREVFGAPLNGYCRRFVARVFDIPEVDSLEIYPGEARAVMTCRDGVGAEAMDRLYRRVACAIASG